MRAEGRQLYTDLFPPDLRTQLETIADRIKTILIKTTGHHVPWEMVTLPPSATWPNEEFLAQRYQVTRWAEGNAPASEIRMRDIVYVAPSYQGAQRLPSAEQEVSYLKSLAGRTGVNATEVPAQYNPVADAIENRDFDVFHFVGHASQTEAASSDQSSLILERIERVDESGTRRRAGEDLEPSALTGNGPRWRARRPLIFLNACQTGRQDIGLVRPGGWASAALASEAGAFVGTLWSVRDNAAVIFCQAFYDALLGGKSFGESAKKARAVVAATGDPSWLAYVVYAHPNAKVILKDPVPSATQ